MSDAAVLSLPWNMLPGQLPEQVFWGASPYQRSAELSPLYVQRYTGPLVAPQDSAHDTWEVITLLRGKGAFHVPPAVYPLMPGYTYLVPPNIAHREVVHTVVDIVWLGLGGPWLEHVPSHQILAVESATLPPLIEQLWLCSQRRAPYIGIELDGLAHAIVGRFYRLHSEAAQHGSDRLDTVIGYMQQHFAEDVSMAKLAAIGGWSAGYCYRLFKQRMGVTPGQYLTRLRVETALTLLRQTKLPIQEIAAHVGYDDALYFSRVCKKLTGRTPSQLRSADYAPTGTAANITSATANGGG